jgi:hypothetical protein
MRRSLNRDTSTATVVSSVSINIVALHEPPINTTRASNELDIEQVKTLS